MVLVRLDSVSVEFGEQALLSDASLAIETNERVCLIGRNGAGKTSLFRLISGQSEPDRGDIDRSADLLISRLEQTLPIAGEETVFEAVAEGLAEIRQLVDEYQRRSGDSLDAQGLRELEALQQRIEAHGGWHVEQRVNTMLSELELPGPRKLRELSGGWQRRVSLARALVAAPDLLLLDEPTNHLDLATIEWLEHKIRVFPGSVLFITHDRTFLQKLATRIVELDRGRLTSWPGDYQNFLRRRDKALEEEATQNALFDKKLAQEEAWIREGIKARRTRNEGRVRALLALRAVRSQRTKQEARARINIDQAEASGRKVIEARNVTHGFGGQPLIKDFTFRVMRGDRIGIIGNNGVGKSTLLKILLGELAPDRGSIKLGTNLEVGHFDQLHTPLDPEKTVADNVGSGHDFVRINGKDRHVISYLNGFLFSAERSMTPVKALSGGESNRVKLAKLFTRATNLLVLDEPTNDLDVETLEVLEERLSQYEGTLLMVSHDRTFLDNVVTSVLVFEADDCIREHVGGYSDWLRRGRELAELDNPNRIETEASKSAPRTKAPSKSSKLSYKLQRELDALPERIEALEHEVASLQQQTNALGFYEQSYEEVRKALDALTIKGTELDRAMERWSELEDLQRELKR